MPNKSHLDAAGRRGLAVPIAAALAVKLVALTALYFAFFTPEPDPTPRVDRAATAILGLR
jgi:hypothetical protein